MLSLFASRAAQRGAAIGRTRVPSLLRGLSTVVNSPKSGDGGNIPVEISSIEEHKRFDPSEWFTDVEDASVRKELSKVRAIEEDLISELSKELPPIDWDAWRAQVRVPGFVDEMKAAYDSIEMPNFDEECKQARKDVEEAFAPLLKQVEQAMKETDKDAESMRAQLDEMTYFHDNIREITVDEVLEKYPKMREEIEDDIANNRWFVS